MGKNLRKVSFSNKTEIHTKVKKNIYQLILFKFIKFYEGKNKDEKKF